MEREASSSRLETLFEPPPPPNQQWASVAEHRYETFARARAARTLAHPHMDRPERSGREVEVIDCQPTQFAQSQAHLCRGSGHHVRSGSGQPLPLGRQVLTPRGKEGCQVLWRRWHADFEVAGVAWPIAVVDWRRDDHLAGQFTHLSRVAQFEGAEEQIDHAGLAPTSCSCSPSLVVTGPKVRAWGSGAADDDSWRGMNSTVDVERTDSDNQQLRSGGAGRGRAMRIV